MSSSPLHSPLDPLIVCLLPGPTGRQTWLQRDEVFIKQVYAFASCQSKLKHTTLLDNGLNALGDCLAEINNQHPQATILLIREDIELPEFWLPRIQAVIEADPDNAVITCLSSQDPRLNPLPDKMTADDNADALVYLAAGGWFTDKHWPEHLAWIGPAAQASLIKHNARIDTAADILDLEGQNIAVCANVFCATNTTSKAGSSAKPLAALGETVKLLSDWQAFGDTCLPLPGLDKKPVLLHLSHNWGGGIDRWIGDFCKADSAHHQLILEARVITDKHQKNLALYLWTENGRLELNSWCLQPAIEATAIEHPQYAQILQQIISYRHIDQLLISSLIGHSLDALSTDVPYLQIIHDFYPLWPFLTEDPNQYTDAGGRFDFDQAWDALHAKRGITLPGNHSLAYWKCLRESYLALLNKTRPVRIAPSQAAVELLQLLEDGNTGEIHQVPHGIDTRKLQTLPPPDQTEKLRLLVPGRIHAGKGKQLLLNAIPEITKIADIYLLGSGKDGEDFFGFSGVHVIYQYQADELATEVARIAPHAALLLSTVPETWSYTFSEMSALGIPLITTPQGAFRERIIEADNGWLIDADAESLVEKIRALNLDRDLLATVAEKLKQQQNITLEDMLNGYRPYLIADYLTTDRQAGEGSQPAQVSVDQLQYDFQAMRGLQLRESIGGLSKQLRQSKAQLKTRTSWAEGLNSELHQINREVESFNQEVERLNLELIERANWAGDLDTELEQTRLEIERLNRELIERTEWAHNWEDLHRQTDESLSQVLGSRSWKLTKPLRAATRLGRNLASMQAYNPARWPYILNRLRQSLAIRGFSGTLQRAQHHKESAPQPDTRAEIISVGTEHKHQEFNANPSIKAVNFNFEEQPEVSIIIPLYNQYAYTQACLQSLKCAANLIPFEVILVDDCSSDKTQKLLTVCTGVSVLRNSENLGFIGSCNRGAEKARGKYLLFLNNDTKVTDHWLDSLHTTFSEFPTAGIVGSRLVYPDGTLQESGGIIFKDASGWNYGRNGNADDPRYQFAREVDYVSGAALMIPANLFAGFGGFDNHYTPAYYEDTDLAFKCRKAGYQVLVQPRSTVIHFEGISSGTDLSKGMKKYQLVNHKKFQQRWEKELLLQPKPIIDPEDSHTVRAAAEHYRGKKLLLIDACTPQPDQDSGSVRIINMMRIFRDLGYQVTFFPDNRQWDGKYSQALQSLGVEVLYGEWIKNLPEFFKLRGPEFDAVIISRHYVAESYIDLLNKYMPQAKFIFDTVDLHYLREQRQAELEQDPALHRAAARSRRAELKIINHADTTLVVSPFEQSILANDAPEARVDVVSNIHPLHGSRKSFAERQNIFFIGGYQHPPNVDSAIWLAKTIWPLIHAELPGVNCFLLGSKAPSVVQKLKGDGLIFKGFVEELEPWLDNCRIALAPLRYGAGVKGKVNMSMSFGQPVVASGIAVEGMYTQNGREVLVADDAESFAREVVRLYQDEDLWNHLSENGLKNVDSHFSFAAAKKNIVTMLSALEE